MGRAGRPPGCFNCGCPTGDPPPPPPPPPPEIDEDATGCFTDNYRYEDSLFYKAGKAFSYSFKVEKGISGVNISCRDNAYSSVLGVTTITLAGGEYFVDICKWLADNFTTSPISWGRVCNFNLRETFINQLSCDACITNGILENTRANFAQIYSCIPPTGPVSDASWWRAGGEFLAPCPTKAVHPITHAVTWTGRCSPNRVKHDITFLNTSEVITPEYNIFYKKYDFQTDPIKTYFVNNNPPFSGCGWFQIYWNVDDNRYILLSGGPKVMMTNGQFAFSTNFTSTDRDYSQLYNYCRNNFSNVGIECGRDLDPGCWCNSRGFARAKRDKLGYGSLIETGDVKYDEWPGVAPNRGGTVTGIFSHLGGYTPSNCLNLDTALTNDEYIQFLIETSDWPAPNWNPSITSSENLCDNCQEIVDPINTLTTGGILAGLNLTVNWPSNTTFAYECGIAGISPNLGIGQRFNEETSGCVSTGNILCSMKWESATTGSP